MMRRCTLFCAAWFWALLLAPLALLIPVLLLQWHDIEKLVADNAQQALRSNGHDWVTVETFNRGRNVLLRGAPPDAQSIEQARRVALNADGVHSVAISGDVRPPLQAPSLEAIVSDKSIVLRGILDSQRSVNATVSSATSAFGANNVVNQLTVGSNTGPLPDLAGLFDALITASTEANSVTATISGSRLSLIGDVADTATSAALEQSLTAIFPGVLDNQLTAITQPPPQVEKVACEELVNELLKNGRVNFDSGRATIETSSLTLLDDIADTAKSCPDARFEVAGHTDSVGNPDSNKALSQRRAEAVVDYLISSGLSEAQFTAVGYGPDVPIGDNATSEGRAQNRRIEFKLKN